MSVMYAFIRGEEGNYPVGSMIAWAGVSKSGYYDWRDRPASGRAVRRAELAAVIRWHFQDSDGTYGYRRIAAAMNAAGQRVDPGTVRAIMAAEGLVAAQPRTSAPRTTIPARDLAQVPDRVLRDFTAAQPGLKLVGDITYIRTWQGWVFLATVLDCFSKKVIGWAMADHMRTELSVAALMMAAQVTGYKPGTFVHTLGDAHIYLDHLEQTNLQLTREPLPLPEMKINPDVKSIFDFVYEDFELRNYQSHPHIKGKVSV